MLTTGLDGGSRTRSAAAMASSTPGPGSRLLGADGDDLVRAGAACSRTQYSWKCTARRPPAGLRVVDHDVGLDPVVAHRQQPHAEAGSPHRLHSASVTWLSG